VGALTDHQRPVGQRARSRGVAGGCGGGRGRLRRPEGGRVALSFGPRSVTLACAFLRACAHCTRTTNAPHAHAAYMAGGSVLLALEDDTYHMWAFSMASNCTMGERTTSSEVVLTESFGPFDPFRQVKTNAPHPKIRAPDSVSTSEAV